MNYCKRHDLAFCERHSKPGGCLDKGCSLVENPLAQFCSVCAGVILPRADDDLGLVAPHRELPPNAVGLGANLQ